MKNKYKYSDRDIIQQMVDILYRNQIISEEVQILFKRRMDETENNFPQFGDNYFTINAEGEVLDLLWRGDNFDNFHKAIGWVFETKEEAENKIKQIKGNMK